MVDTTQHAWDLIRGEAALWAIEPGALKALAAAMAARPVADDAPRHDLTAIGARGVRRSPAASSSTAVIAVHGPLVRRGSMLSEMFGLSSYSQIRAEVNQAVSDPSVDRILLHVDSPGGSAMGCEECAADVAQASRKKTVIAYADGMMTSAAYWVASAAGGGIIATPSAEIGSIGVFQLHADMSRALDMAGITPTFIVSKVSPHKVEGNPYEPIGDTKESMQSDVDAIAAKFVSAVARGRGVTETEVKARFGGGRVLFASGAQAAGMVDSIGSVADALRATPLGMNRVAQYYRARLVELAHASPRQAEVEGCLPNRV